MCLLASNFYEITGLEFLRMKIYTIIVLIIMTALLVIFGLASILNWPFLSDLGPILEMDKWLAALSGVGLLILDVFFPVPSSLIMIANGAIFNVAVGTVLSLIGSLGAALLGYGLGASGARITDRFTSQEEQERAKLLLHQRGMLAVIVSRPIPILAETVSIVAGLSGMKLPRFIIASVIGTLPITVVYALTGAAVADLDSGVIVFALVLLAAGLFWLLGNALKRVLPAVMS